MPESTMRNLYIVSDKITLGSGGSSENSSGRLVRVEEVIASVLN